MRIPNWLKENIKERIKELLPFILGTILFIIGAYLWFENGRLEKQIIELKESIDKLKENKWVTLD